MNFTNIKNIQQNIEGTTLGNIVWWSLSDNNISHSELERLFDKLNLDKKYMPVEITPIQAFRRSWRYVSTKLDSKNLMLRGIAEDEKEITVGVVRELPNEEKKDLDYSLLARIIFDKSTSNISSDFENGVSGKIRYMYNHFLSHNTDDVRKIFTVFLNEAGIRVRQNGGVYYTPNQFEKTLNSICTLVEKIGCNQTYQLPIVDTMNAKNTLKAITKSSLDNDIKRLQDEIDKFDKSTMRSSTLDKKLQDFENIRSRAKLFSRILNFRADKINKKIKQLKTDLKIEMGIPVESTPEPKPKIKQTLTIYPAHDAIVGF